MGKEEKKLLIAVVVLALVLGIGGYFKQQKLDQEESEIAKTVFFETQNLQKISIENKKGSQTLLHKDLVPGGPTHRDDEFVLDHLWYVQTEPVQYAKPSNVDTLMSSLDEMEIMQRIDATPERLEEYGLSQPRATLTLKNDQEVKTFLFGDQTNDEFSRYVLDKQANEVLLVSQNIDYIFLTEPQEWVEKNVLTLSHTEPPQLIFDSGEVGKKEEKWNVKLGSDVYPGHPEEIVAYIRNVNSLQAKATMTDEALLSMPSDATLTLVDGEKKLVLSLKQREGISYIQRSDQPWLFQVTQEQADSLFVAPDSLVDLGLQGVLPQMKRVNLRVGDQTYAFDQGAEWLANKPFQDAVDMERLDALVDLFATIAPKERVREKLEGAPIVYEVSGADQTTSILLDVAKNRLQIQGESPSTWWVSIPQMFQVKLKEHLDDIRKNDLFPHTQDQMVGIILKKDEKMIEIKKNPDGSWAATPEMNEEDVEEIKRLVQEIKIDRFESRDNFKRNNEFELVVQTESGFAYTWHVGDIENQQWMILNMPKFVAGWVDAPKLAQLIKKL